MAEIYVYQNEDAKVIPGNDWPEAVNGARSGDKVTPGLKRIERLGSALAGVVSQLNECGVDLNEFAVAATPPLNGRETSQFRHGFIQGRNVLLMPSSVGAVNV